MYLIAVTKNTGERKVGDLLALVEPDDLLQYGLIPEIIGRLPVVATLGELDAEALMKILLEPKNALIKQYQALLELAMTKKTGARSLRAILEEVMLEVMFQAPVQIGLQEVVITKATVKEKTLPIYVQGKESKQSA